jgi:hypothetical protein
MLLLLLLLLTMSLGLIVLLLEDASRLVRVNGDTVDPGITSKDAKLVGKTFKPDWGDSGAIWIPRT